MSRARLLTATIATVVFASSVVSPAAAQEEPIDFSDAPFVIFAPAPPKPLEIYDYPIPDGAEDYWDLWADEAPWKQAAEHIDAFATHGWILRYSTTDEDLRRMIEWLDERGIPLGMEVEPLTWPGPDVCDHTESFEGPYEYEEIRRVFTLGGRIEFLSLDEPYSHAHKLTGPGACRYSVEQVVDEVAAFVEQVRGLYPDIKVGSIEPLWTDPRIDARDMEIWLDTWAERTGEPFAFLSVDVDWRRDDWPAVVRAVEAVADARGVPLGMLYLGSHFTTENDAWLAQMAQHAATLEVGNGVTPDIVGFYSWLPQPDRLLPDDDLDAYTGRINQYFGTRTAIEAPTVEGKLAAGRLVTLDGQPMAGRELAVTAVPLDGSKARHRLSGTVPESAREALVAVRANIEGGSPGPVDVRISDVDYREEGGRNKVPNPRFRQGLESWGAYGTGQTTTVRREGDMVMRVKAKAKQSIAIDGQRFKVTPGAAFDFAATLDVPGKSSGTGYISVIFLGDSEVARENLVFLAQPVELPAVTTDEDGVYRIPLGELRPGRYELVLTHDGDIDYWAANAEKRVWVR